jgi:hypothetical protein
MLVFWKIPLVDEIRKTRGFSVIRADPLLPEAQPNRTMRRAPSRRRFELGQQSLEARRIAVKKLAEELLPLLRRYQRGETLQGFNAGLRDGRTMDDKIVFVVDFTDWHDMLLLGKFE